MHWPSAETDIIHNFMHLHCFVILFLGYYYAIYFEKYECEYKHKFSISITTLLVHCLPF